MTRFTRHTKTLCAAAALCAAVVGAGTALTAPHDAMAADVVTTPAAPVITPESAPQRTPDAARTVPAAIAPLPPHAGPGPGPGPGTGPRMPPPGPHAGLPPPPPMFNPWGLPPSFARLALTAQQEDAVFEIMHKQVAEMRVQARLARDAALTLSAMADDESFDEAAARKTADTLGQAEAQMRFIQVRDAQRIRATLTPEQRVVWDDDDEDDAGMPPPGYGAPGN